MLKNIYFKYRKIISLAIPVAIENIIYSSINFIDVFMVGKNIPSLMLGASAISALGVSNQIFFIFLVALFGLFSGASVLSSQYYGNKNFDKLREIGNLLLIISLVFSFGVLAIILIFPYEILGFYLKDKNTVNLAISYITIVVFSYPIIGVGFSITTQLRSINKPKYSLYSSMLGILINFVLNYILIFGKFGMTALGVQGAAIATLIARVISNIYLMYIVYKYDLPVYGNFKNIINIKLSFIIKFLSISIPTFLHEIIWVLGSNVRMSIFAHMGDIKFSALEITATLSSILFALYTGISNACSVILGNLLGENNNELAIKESKKAIHLTLFIGVICFLVFNLFSTPLLYIMGIEKQVFEITKSIIFVESVLSVLKAINLLILIGILRAGGDIVVAVILDLLPLWLVSIPLTYIAYRMELSVSMIYLIAGSEEIIKFIPLIIRYKNKRWINNLVSS